MNENSSSYHFSWIFFSSLGCAQFHNSSNVTIQSFSVVVVDSYLIGIKNVADPLDLVGHPSSDAWREFFFQCAFETYKWPSENWFFSEIDKISISVLSVSSYFSRVVCVFIRIARTHVQICVCCVCCACMHVCVCLVQCLYKLYIICLPICLFKHDCNHAHSFPNIVYSGRLDLLINWEEKLTEWH